MLGQSIAHYRVTEKIGAGGMGEVYRARDTKLNRDVALKVLPEVFANDAERMARFRREAQVLASLNHPNIAAIYGLEESGGVPALVLELVEGPTLSERIREGALSCDEALNIAKQIADALEAAHDPGIIHRDLKPANVKVRDDGTVKVLDFGLAKALEGSDAEEDVSNSPTLSIAATRTGVILGTAAYMSPEQAKGRKADRRSDVWAFGVVLFEMLTGRRVYTGETISEVLASVIKEEPDWDSLPEDTPAAVRKLLRRSLQKDPRQRLQAIGEARIALAEYEADSAASVLMTGPVAAPQPAWQRVLPWAVAAVMTVAFIAALWGLLRTPEPVAGGVSRFDIDVSSLTLQRPSNGRGGYLAISPDGRRIAVLAREGEKVLLHQRMIDQLDFIPIPGTEGAYEPFFSPDSQWAAFFADGKLKKVPMAGGVPLTLCELPGIAADGTWGDDGAIVFSVPPNLYRVPAGGGTPEVVGKPDPESATTSFMWPSFLPGSRAVLFTNRGTLAQGSAFQIGVLPLDTREGRILIESGAYPRYAAPATLFTPRRALEGREARSPGACWQFPSTSTVWR